MEHYCDQVEEFPAKKYFQKGRDRGEGIVIVGESPAENGWRKSGRACYTPEGKLLATGKRLNELLFPLGLNVETCGFTELTKCFVGKDRYLLKECSKKCWPIFAKQLKLSKAKLIILLGIKTSEIFNEINNTNFETGTINNFSIGKKEYAILPIYHPSPVNPHGREKNIRIFELNRAQIESIIN